MLEFAENEFELAQRQKDGATLREHLMAAEAALRRPIDKLHVECPRALVYVWDWFCDISSSRKSGYGGSEPISYEELRAWQALNGIELTKYELSLIRKIDRTFINVSRKVKSDGN